MMTKAQQRLMKKHGTPEQFEKAIWKAFDYCMITKAEAVAGIAKYKAEWEEAGH